LKTKRKRPLPSKSNAVGNGVRPDSGGPQGGLPGSFQKFRVPLLVLLYALLALNFIRLPKVPVAMTHDLGSDMSFEFYAKAKYQFGRDVIQNVGPYGYLQNPHSYSGILPTQKLLFGVLFGMTVAWFALGARRYFATTTAKAVWFLTLFFTLVLSQEQLDPICDLFALLAGHHLLLSDRTRGRRFIEDAVICVVFGLLILMKITNLMTFGLLLMLVAVERVRTRQFVDLACNLACLGVSTVLLWLLAGQKFSNVFAFMRSAKEFSKGYNEALATYGNPVTVWLGVIVIIAFVAFNALRFLQWHKYSRRLTTTVFEAGCIFVIWKHGYVRSDHGGFFWASILTAAPLLFLAHERPLSGGSPKNPVPTRPGRIGILRTNLNMYRLAAAPIIITIICTISACRVEIDNESYSGYASLGSALEGPLDRICANFSELADWPSRRRSLDARVLENRASAVLPQVKKTVGDATIDEFGYLPGIILLNNLNYTPRPMAINFGATTEMIMRRNEDFYRNDATAPAFLLANIGQIDGRLAPQDDALALLQVLQRYQPLLIDKDMILLKHVPGQPNLERVLQDTRTIAWDQSVTLPSSNGKWLWCSVDIEYSLRGRAQSFLLRPPSAYIVLDAPGRRLGPVRVLPSGAGTGFLLRPLILNPIDFLTAYGLHVEPASALTPEFDSIRFVTQDPEGFKPDLKLSFWTVETNK